jgi:H(+)-translocating pyrophosphatase
VAIAGAGAAIIAAFYFFYQVRSFHARNIEPSLRDSWPPEGHLGASVSSSATPNRQILLIFFWFRLFSSQYFFYDVQVMKEKVEDAEMKRLSAMIQKAAKAYLKTQYQWLLVWIACLFIIIACILRTDNNNVAGLYTALSYLFGSILSGAAGWVGMMTATSANARTAEACKTSISRGLQVSFGSGAVMGNGVVGLAISGLWVLYLIWTSVHPNSNVNVEDFNVVWGYIAGFGFGASSIGMFARVGGGVFTKAADVGADLVGKVEQGIPEDDPRNPAVIADNVGDNVGDVAGMGADLFESYAGALIACAALSPSLHAIASASGWTDMTEAEMLMSGAALPFWVYGLGIICSLIGTIVVRAWPLSDSATLSTLLRTINIGINVSSVLTIGTTIACCVVLFDSPLSWRLFGCVIIGLFAGVVISRFTEYCTSYEDAPTRDISAASEYGHAPVIIKGLGVGMLSVSVPTVMIVITILACDALAALYGVSIAAVGMLSTLGITLATDAYGPVADNAGGIAEMAGLPSFVRSRTDKLDSLGNTTAATGKGLAIGSAILTSVGLIAAFLEQSTPIAVYGARNFVSVDIREPIVLAGVVIGTGLPFIFGALTMLSVDRGARAIITEVRLQFALAPELMKGALTQTVDGQTFPDTERCVRIATTAAVQEMVLPGLLAVFTPVSIGFLLGPKGLGGLLAGSLGTCFMLALTMANSGGAWDNAKKWVERCAEEGEPITVVGADGKKTESVTFTNFGVKKAHLFSEIEATHGFAALIKIAGSEPTTDEDKAKLRETLLELYHTRHSAVVTGDTCGDPFKDTSGPALNVLSKTMTMVALMLAPLYRSMGMDEGFQGFRSFGTITAAVIFVIIAALGVASVIVFGRSNTRKFNEAIALKKAADAKAFGDAKAAPAPAAVAVETA